MMLLAALYQVKGEKKENLVVRINRVALESSGYKVYYLP